METVYPNNNRQLVASQCSPLEKNCCKSCESKLSSQDGNQVSLTPSAGAAFLSSPPGPPFSHLPLTASAFQRELRHLSQHGITESMRERRFFNGKSGDLTRNAHSYFHVSSERHFPTEKLLKHTNDTFYSWPIVPNRVPTKIPLAE